MSASGFFAGFLGEIGDNITKQKELSAKQEIDQHKMEMELYRSALENPNLNPAMIPYLTQKYEEMIPGAAGTKSTRPGGKGKGGKGGKGMLSGVIQGFQQMMGGGQQQPPASSAGPLPKETFFSPEQKQGQALDLYKKQSDIDQARQIAVEKAKPRTATEPKELARGPFTAEQLSGANVGQIVNLDRTPFKKDQPGHYSLYDDNGKKIAVPAPAPSSETEKPTGEFEKEVLPGEASRLFKTTPDKLDPQQREQIFSAYENKKKQAEINAAITKSRIEKQTERDIKNEEEDKDNQTIIEGVLNGDLLSLNQVGGAMGGQKKKLVASLMRAGIDPASLDRKVAMAKDLTTGKLGDQLMSWDIFTRHAGEVSDAVQDIRLSSVPMANKPLNWWRKNLTGDPRLARLETALEPVKQELATNLASGRAPFGRDKETMDILLDDKSTPAQLQGALKQMLRTVKDRASGINFRAKTTLGKNYKLPIDPDVIDIAGKLGVDLNIDKGTIQSQGANGGQPTHAVIVNGKVIGYTSDGKTMTPATQ